jgi:AcrR family transcriptional regulator
MSSPGTVVTVGTPLDAEATLRRLTPRQAATVARLADAVVDELAEGGYDGLTVRSVARRAGVAPATAYTYFTSKAHLVAEVFWRRLRALPDTEPPRRGRAAARVAAVYRDIAGLVAGAPWLAAASSPALLADDPDVRVLRDRIGAELHRRLRDALAGPGDGGEDEDVPAPDERLVTALDLVLTGALVRVGMGHMTYDDLAGELAELAGLVIGDRP